MLPSAFTRPAITSGLRLRLMHALTIRSSKSLDSTLSNTASNPAASMPSTWSPGSLGDGANACDPTA